MGVEPDLAVGGVSAVAAGVRGTSLAGSDPLLWPTDLFFSMTGLTSSVASALSELSLSDVDLGSSVHSTPASRRPSAQAPPTGESSRGRTGWRKARRQSLWLGVPGSSGEPALKPLSAQVRRPLCPLRTPCAPTRC